MHSVNFLSPVALPCVTNTQNHAVGPILSLRIVNTASRVLTGSSQGRARQKSSHASSSYFAVKDQQDEAFSKVLPLLDVCLTALHKDKEAQLVSLILVCIELGGTATCGNVGEPLSPALRRQATVCRVTPRAWSCLWPWLWQ